MTEKKYTRSAMFIRCMNEIFEEWDEE